MPRRIIPIPSPIFLLFALLVVISPCQSSGNVIYQTCKKTHYNSLCVSTLRSDPRSAAADPAGLARIALDILLPKANATFSLALKLWEETSTSTSLYRLYGSCVDVYGGSVSTDIPNALTELASKKFSAAKSNADRVAGKADFCGGQFGETTPLTAGNRQVHDLATVAADIIGSLG